jgi:hypothetical protein
MAAIILIVLTTISFCLVHFSIYFLEREKASGRKAGVVLLCFFLFNNSIRYLGIEMPWPVEWASYIGFVSVVIWLLFRLKPLHSVTAATFYLVGRMAAVYLFSLVPLEVLNA